MATVIPRILRLPLELRQQIYSWILVDDLETRKVNVTIEQQPGRYILHGLETIRGLVFVNHALHRDILDDCFGRYDFHLNNDTESVRFVVREFYRQIGPDNRKLVKHITLPSFSIDAVFFQPANMVSLFEGRAARYFQLLNETQMAFLMLARFPALTELDFGLDLLETTRRRNQGDFEARARAKGGRLPNHDSFMLEVMGEAKHLAPTVKVGIWWSSGCGRLSEAEVEKAQEVFLEYLRTKVGPIQVEFKKKTYRTGVAVSTSIG
jgi:hypothetical protein